MSWANYVGRRHNLWVVVRLKSVSPTNLAIAIITLKGSLLLCSLLLQSKDRSSPWQRQCCFWRAGSDLEYNWSPPTINPTHTLQDCVWRLFLLQNKIIPFPDFMQHLTDLPCSLWSPLQLDTWSIWPLQFRNTFVWMQRCALQRHNWGWDLVCINIYIKPLLFLSSLQLLFCKVHVAVAGGEAWGEADTGPQAHRLTHRPSSPPTFARLASTSCTFHTFVQNLSATKDGSVAKGSPKALQPHVNHFSVFAKMFFLLQGETRVLVGLPGRWWKYIFSGEGKKWVLRKGEVGLLLVERWRQPVFKAES